jgi:hypothetical protein
MTEVRDYGPTRPQANAEAMRSAFDLRIGRHVSLQGTFQITPAGVICGGLAVAMMTLALGIAASSHRRRRP